MGLDLATEGGTVSLVDAQDAAHSDGNGGCWTFAANPDLAPICDLDAPMVLAPR